MLKQVKSIQGVSSPQSLNTIKMTQINIKKDRAEGKIEKEKNEEKKRQEYKGQFQAAVTLHSLC